MLDILGRHHGTDKASNGHDYLNWYERFISDFRDKPAWIFEMGVFGGDSLRMWRDFFPLGNIIGLDLVPEAKQYSEERIIVETGDQSDSDVLNAVMDKYGPFDVIIDDAGHDPAAQLFSFKYLFPAMSAGGYYLLEDIWIPEVVNFFADLGAAVVQLGSTNNLARLCETISFHREAVIIQRNRLYPVRRRAWELRMDGR